MPFTPMGHRLCVVVMGSLTKCPGVGWRPGSLGRIGVMAPLNELLFSE
jgi:hypothetical protein